MLRHTYATELMVAGVNPIVVRDLLRHSTVNTTWNVYTHPSVMIREKYWMIYMMIMLSLWIMT